MEEVMTDFYVPPYDDPEAAKEDYGPLLPLHYYDNDDGFWDTYIEMKQKRWEEHDMIVRRPFVKH